MNHWEKFVIALIRLLLNGNFPFLNKTSKGHWLGVADFKSGHELVKDQHFPNLLTTKVHKGDYVTLMTYKEKND